MTRKSFETHFRLYNKQHTDRPGSDCSLKGAADSPFRDLTFYIFAICPSWMKKLLSMVKVKLVLFQKSAHGEICECMLSVYINILYTLGIIKQCVLEHMQAV